MLKLAIANELAIACGTFVCLEMVVDVRIALFSRCEAFCTNVACEFEIFDRLNFQLDLLSGQVVHHSYIELLHMRIFENDIFRSIGFRFDRFAFWHSPSLQLLAHIECKHVIGKMCIANDMISGDLLPI